MSQQNPQTEWIGYLIGGRYKIESYIAEGGMSTVYKATDPNLQRTVAVKIIHPHLCRDEQFIRRFELEAAAVAQLRHPNIIQVYDFNHDDNIYYMVLEFVSGETLQARLKTLSEANRRMPLEEVIPIMATTTDAVGYAHEQHMIHRDLKPANVMLNPQGQPILMDFGVAKMLGTAQHTATGAVLGTAKYMSPEQARGDNPDARSDIYSLGIMLYEMVAGTPPFDDKSAVVLLMKHVSEPLPDIRQIKPDAPEALVKVIEKALAKERDERYQSAKEMAAALRAVLTLQTSPPELEATIMQSLEELAIEEAASVSSVAAQPAQPTKAGIPSWIIGAGVVVLLLIIGLGVFFVFSGSGNSVAVDGSNGDTEEPAPTAADTGPPLPSSEGMVKIPGGSYTVGVDVLGETYAPTQQVELNEFWIDQYEVTNAQYAQFLAETDQEAPADWSEGSFPSGEENHPVDEVSWDSAVAYCQWANKRLPTEAEWEVAARGTEGLLFPWGNNPNDISLPQSGTYAVGSNADDQSPFGVYDMGGNVWEWVGDTYAPLEPGNRLLRGGANGFLQNMAYRLQGDPNIPTMMASAGIRCAADEAN